MHTDLSLAAEEAHMIRLIVLFTHITYTQNFIHREMAAENLKY